MGPEGKKGTKNSTWVAGVDGKKKIMVMVMMMVGEEQVERGWDELMSS